MKKRVLLIIGLIMLMLCVPMGVQASDARYELEDAYVIVPEPLAGTVFPLASNCTVATMGNGANILSVSWYRVDGSEFVRVSGIAVEGEEYVCKVGLTVVDYRRYFTSSTVMHINGKVQEVLSQNAVYIEAYSQPMLSRTVVISSIDVSMTLPVVDANISDSRPTVSTNGVWVEYHFWNEQNRTTSDKVFAYGKNYKFEICLGVERGYVFADNVKVTLQNGRELEVVGWSDDKRSMLCYSETFNMPNTRSILMYVMVNVPHPVAGRTPSDTKVTCSESRVSINNVQWFIKGQQTSIDVDEKFVEGVEYACRVQVRVVRNEFLFDNVTTMHFDGLGLGNRTQMTPEFFAAITPYLKAQYIPIENLDIYFEKLSLKGSINSCAARTKTNGIKWFNIVWYDADTGERTTHKVFQAGHAYIPEITVTAHDSYRFGPKLSVSIAGDSVITQKQEKQSLTIRPSNPIIVGIEAIENIDLDISWPLVGLPIAGASIWPTTPGVGIVGGQTFDESGKATSLEDFYEEGKYYRTLFYFLLDSDTHVFDENTTITYGDVVVKEKESWDDKHISAWSPKWQAVPVKPVNKDECILRGIRSLRAVTGVANGSPKTTAGLGLPGTVILGTTTGNVRTSVMWDVDACSYNVGEQNEQKFTVQGLVTLPSGVSNPNNVALRVRINVTVKAKGDTSEPTEPSYEISDDADIELYYVEWLVHYDANGGYGPVPEDVFVQSGQPYTIATNTFAREDHVFSGWRTAPEGGTFHAPATTFVVNEDTTLYAQWTAIPPKPIQYMPEEDAPGKDETLPKEDAPSKDETLPQEDAPLYEGSGTKPTEKSSIQELQFTIDSMQVLGDGTDLPELDVPAMVLNGRTMIPFRYFIETALGGVANFDASSYTISATVLGHNIIMVVEDTTIYVDGQAVELSQAPTIVDSRTLVPLRMIETIAKSVGWDPLTRKATIVL